MDVTSEITCSLKFYHASHYKSAPEDDHEHVFAVVLIITTSIKLSSFQNILDYSILLFSMWFYERLKQLMFKKRVHSRTDLEG